MRKEIHKKKVGELLHKIAEIEINLDIKKIEYKELEEENRKLKDLNSELSRINNKIMDQLEQKTRLVNYYRREKAKRDRFIDLWDTLRIWECE